MTKGNFFFIYSYVTVELNLGW